MKLDRKQVEKLLAADSLGLLNPSEAEQLETYLQTADDEVRQLRNDYRQVVGLLGLDAPTMRPPASLKAQVMARVKTETDRPQRETRPSEEFHFVRASLEPWNEIFPGISIKTLHQKDSMGFSTALIRMTPGSRLPAHRHMGEEEVYMLEGQGEMDGVRYQAGDYLFSKSDSVHGETRTTTGCLLFCRLPAIEFMI